MFMLLIKLFKDFYRKGLNIGLQVQIFLFKMKYYLKFNLYFNQVLKSNFLDPLNIQAYQFHQSNLLLHLDELFNVIQAQ